MSKEAKFTGGKWKAVHAGKQMQGYKQPCGIMADLGDGKATLIAGVFEDVLGGEVAMEANGRLLAAAPDLYAALDTAIQTIEQLIPEESARGVADLVLFQARTALAKARGETL